MKNIILKNILVTKYSPLDCSIKGNNYRFYFNITSCKEEMKIYANNVIDMYINEKILNRYRFRMCLLESITEKYEKIKNNTSI